MPTDRVIVVGAGIAGLVAALDLAVRGLDVLVLERAATPGGKLRQVVIDGQAMDAGPTVFTLKRVFEELFADAGEGLHRHLTLRPLDLLARHAWDAEARLDLFADVARSADAIGRFAGSAEARGYLEFAARAKKMFETLDAPFMRNPAPTPLSLVAAAGPRAMLGVSPFTTLWKALGAHFQDARLRQLFGRYATYSGASPFQCPATLMLIAHVEQDGVWAVDGGMHRIARVLEALIEARGGQLRYGAHVAAILASGGRTSGVRLLDGEVIAADAVICNTDAAALATGLLGAGAARAMGSFPAPRSLSAVTWTMLARAEHFPLPRHTVFFGPDYAEEFDAVFQRGALPRQPTVYVCAQDRDDSATAPDGPERLLCLVNAPAIGDQKDFSESEIEQCTTASFDLLARCGLTLHRDPRTNVLTTPKDWNALFPATGGALYGPALHGWNSSFRRPTAGTKLPGLFLAGGSVHPGPGVPMAALSGRMAARALLASRSRSRPAAMPGGMSMR
jgi:1-hydroxycarotenoid 3,4-desaturase